MAIAEVTNIAATLGELKEGGYWIIGLDGSGDKLYTDVDYSTPVALVIGNEGKGIRRLVRETCDHLVRIPQRGKIESLNASVAGALAMYEVVRARKL
jgi:23S rRNA (guanosine2251-2'-O)-methyltransferase